MFCRSCRITAVNDTLSKRLEDLETTRSKERVDEKETLKQLNEIKRQLRHVEKQIEDRGKETTLTARLTTELLSQGKVVSFCRRKIKRRFYEWYASRFYRKNAETAE